MFGRQKLTQSLDKPVTEVNPGYHVATKQEMKALNRSLSGILKMTDFYNKNLANSKVDYVYKTKDGLGILKTNFDKRNFSHLLGIRFDRANARRFFNDLVNRKLDQNAVFVKNDNTTILKTKMAKYFPKIVNCKSVVLRDLSNTPQAQHLNLKSGIKSKNNRLGLFFRPTQNTEINIPVSMLNLKAAKNKSEYRNIPENTILGIFREEIDYNPFDPQKKKKLSLGRGTIALSLNRKYLKRPEQIQELGMQVRKALITNFKTDQMLPKERRQEQARKAFLARRRGLER